MIWALLKKVPKYALVLLVLIGSTVAFFIWKATYRARHFADFLNKPGVVEDVGPKVAKVEAGHERMVLVDNDLYDVESGEAVFRNWLKKGMPLKLYWEPESKTVLAQYPLGYVRYGLDGVEKASLLAPHPFAMSEDRKWIVYAKDKNIWKADVDWNALKAGNERKITSIAQFNDANFAANIVLGSDKTLIVLNGNQGLRVNLETGDVHPVKLQLGGIAKRRSPDGKSGVGFLNGQFFCYDVDSDQAKTVPVGRSAINDYQWLDNDRCAVIVGGTHAAIYYRKQNSLNEIVGLPVQCSKIGEPSPDGRFVFCYGWKGGALVDLEKKTTTSLTGEGVVSWVSSDTFVLARDVPDSSLRGTWLKAAGETERRISTEPFVASNAGSSTVAIKPAGLIVLVMKQGLARMKANGTEFSDIVNRGVTPQRVLAIEEWPR